MNTTVLRGVNTERLGWKPTSEEVNSSQDELTLKLWETVNLFIGDALLGC